MIDLRTHPACACSPALSSLEPAIRMLFSCARCTREIFEGEGTGHRALQELARRYGAERVERAVVAARRGHE